MNIRKYSIFTWYGIQAPERERFTAIRKAGFRSVMLWWGDDLAFAEYDKSELVHAAMKADLEIENIHVPYRQANDLWSDDEHERRTIIEEHRNWIRDCSKYGIPMMVMHISTGDRIKTPNDNGLDTFETLCLEAEKEGIVLAIENTRTINLLRFILGNIDCDALGLCYDTSHGKLYERRPFELMGEFPDRIRCFHISDNDGNSDKHWNIGEGMIDWNGFVSRFPQKYDGNLSLEILPKNEEDEEELLRTAYREIEKLAKEIEISR